MVSKAKLYTQLDRMEAELRERLVPHLEKAAVGENDFVFCATAFNSYAHLKDSTDAETDSLIQLGGQILVLREKLGEPTAGSIAERICWYCRKWEATGDGQRNATQGLAIEFLKEVTYMRRKT